MSEEEDRPQEESPAAEGEGQQPPPGGETPELGAPSERSMAMLCHLLGIFTGFLAPLIIWLIKKDEAPFVDDQGKEALNFQITVMIASAAGAMLTWVLVGCFLLPAVWICDIIFCIMGAVAANKGERYRYPVSIRFIK